MKDNRGIYYYPNPQYRRVKMYIRLAADGQIEFRMDNVDEPQIWDRHGWVPLEAVRQAAVRFRELGRGADPMTLYDENVARALLREEGLV